MKKMIQGALASAAAATLLTVAMAQSQNQGDRRNQGGDSSKNVVTLDASGQTTKLENTPLCSPTGSVMAVPIDIRELAGYREGLELAGFCVSGRLENASASSSATSGSETSRASETGSSKGSTSGKPVMVAAVVASKPDLKQDDIVRLVHKRMMGTGSGRASDSEIENERSSGQTEKDRSKTGSDEGDRARGTGETGGSAAIDQSAAVLLSCRITQSQLDMKELSFEVLGVGSAETGADEVRQVFAKMNLTTREGSGSEGTGGERIAHAKSADRLQVRQPDPKDVANALKLVQSGNAYLYFCELPQEMQAGSGESGQSSGISERSAAGAQSMSDLPRLTLKDLNIVFAAVPKS